ncbi:tyrosine-type recombinase/integrase [Paenibacillus alvei]|uniref:tyrosine-type recombinase/integrase n=1 Tax=Paenibacillus alvei TaxID=44250 RepID=UPI00227E769F|nr:tyrosine-type recombinase/integrase [Paenibacillus alvei]MCY9738199.1 tyrosine-type recombinase/integrase [Paenibacillus alvei]
MMPLIQQNVVTMKTSSVFQDITTFLKKHNIGNGDKYKGTAEEYHRDIIQFFKLMLGKELHELEVKDLDIRKKDVERYQTFLSDNGYKSSYINRKIGSVRSLYKFFQENRYRYKDDNNEWVYIKADDFNVKKVDKKDLESSGLLSHDEMRQYINEARSLPNGEEKSLCLELASVTSFRLDAVVNLKYTDFRNENGVWVVKTIDKSKENEKSIRHDLYERLLNIKKDDDKLFHMSTRTMERTFETITKKLGLDPDRNLSFHSVKKYGIGEVWHISGGDFLKTAEQGNHSSFETNQKYYLLFGKDYSTMPSLLIGQDIDMSPLQDLSKEQLLELIEAGGRGLQFKMLNLLKEMSANKSFEI